MVTPRNDTPVWSRDLGDGSPLPGGAASISSKGQTVSAASTERVGRAATRSARLGANDHVRRPNEVLPPQKFAG